MDAYFEAVQQPVLILVAYERDLVPLIEKLAGVCISGWEKYISVRGYDPKRQNFEAYTDGVIDDYLEYKAERVYYQRSTLDGGLLKKSGVASRPCGSFNTIFSEVSSLLKGMGLHWLPHAEREWAKSAIKSTNPERWIQQFSEIDQKQVGISILKSLRVFTSDELSAAFRLPKSEEIGFKVAHAFISEDEPGSSSIAVQNILEHMHPEGAVVPLDLSRDDALDVVDCDILYIYEDGLWSGVELVKRLCRIQELNGFRDSSLHVVFKYCVTSDAGLTAARLFTLRSALGRFSFPSATKRFHFDFFKKGTDTRFPNLPDYSWETVRAAIDDSIEPYAFSDEKLWPDGTANAMAVCADIGAQLLTARMEKSPKGGEEAQASVINQRKLGAMSFGSTMVFEYSVPKPVLPILWLQGDVIVNGKVVSWRPLFWDARRIGKVEHHI
ncbi:hypothetical protein [Pseudomonas palleroniana]|uniref:PRTase-CE domain-containing protein n=1 Tax=Pseudomonas palleroniana TaxID=191390 RepID=A0A0X7JYY4_9PSED|nr:hypothetical protein [Pseudomonas palleroniana]KWU48659.1 hypothetical protein AWV77_22350 [Pseudomonas palleroniana]